ncbi:MAG: FmdB family zinc ribbon protein [Solirubrobacterales bacterium]
MPIYEYKRADGTTFEVIQKFSDDPLTNDPETGEPVERVYTAPAIHFKGSGFHNTDYGSKRRPKAGSEDASSSSGSASAPSSSSGESGSASSKSDTSGSSAGKQSDSKKTGDSSPKKSSE